MNKEDVRLAKERILECLTENFDYGRNGKMGEPLRKQNRAIFDKSEGWAVYYDTDLDMIMCKVILGLHLALEDSKKETNK